MTEAGSADPDLVGLARTIIDRAAPDEELEVAVGRSFGTSVRVYEGEIEAFTVAETSGIGIRVVSEGRVGFASAGSLDADIVADALAEARDNLAFAEPDPYLALAHPDGVAARAQDRWSDDVLATSPEDKIDLALALEARVRAGDPRITGVRSAGYDDAASSTVLVSTAGIESATRSTAASLGVSALSSDDGQTQTGYGRSYGRSPLDLDVDEAARDAVHRATRLLGATQPESGRVTLVLEPRLAASLLGIVGGMLSGERVLKGRTPFADRVGDQIANPGLHLVDDPTDSRSYGAASFDGEGLACRRNTLIDGGVLAGFLHNTHTGARMGTASNAAAVRGVQSTPGVGARALAVRPGEGTLDDLVSAVDHGVLVNSMAGLHSGVNPVSGDFSVGIDGIMIRSGALAEPLREATVASAIQRLLTGVVGIGGDLEFLPGGTVSPTLAVEGVSLSGR